MANKRGKAIDKTHLSLDTATERGFIHRDYLAHCLRWTHVVKYLQSKQRYKKATILDIGCGKEVPLAKTLYSSRLIVKDYLGVDVNKLTVPEMFHTGKFPISLISGDVTKLELPERNIITCFEVVEHIEPEHVHRLLIKIADTLSAEGRAFISTPCFNGKAAANHVNEMTYAAFGRMLEDHRFIIEATYGTFASISDYKDNLAKWDLQPAFNALREYYDVNLLSIIFAPLFPGNSRNCLWKIKLDPYNGGTTPVFPAWKNIETPYSSSEHWEDCRDGTY